MVVDIWSISAQKKEHKREDENSELGLTLGD